MYYRARFYDPAIGRFISRDPIGLSAGINVYAYVGNDPVNFTDPSGLLARGVSSTLNGWGSSANSYYDSAKSSVTGAASQFSNNSLVRQLSPTLSSFGSGFVGSQPLSGSASNAEILGRRTRIAVEYSLIVFDVLNSPISPGPDFGMVGAAGITARTVAAKGVAEGLAFTKPSLQHTFKHAKDFGVNGNANTKTLSELSSALQTHVDAAGTRLIQGAYRGNPATHHLDPQTGLNVIQDASGNLLSGWKLSPQQLQNVLTREPLINDRLARTQRLSWV